MKTILRKFLLNSNVICLCLVVNYCNCAPRSYNDNYGTNSYNRLARQSGNAYKQSNYYAGYYRSPNSISDRYHSNRYRSDYRSASSKSSTARTTTFTPLRRNTDNYHFSRADAENTKFAGARNQEQNDLNGDTKTLLLRNRIRKLNALYARPCSPFGRDVKGRSASAEQGRFLFDLNVYNVGAGIGCGGYGSYGGLGSFDGALSDSIAPAAPLPYPARPITPFGNFLASVLQSAIAARPVLANPVSYAGLPLPTGSEQNPQIDPTVDPNYVGNPTRPVPNRVYYDSAGAAPLTPGQLVGGVASTVNGIIQQLTGNVQPVYG